VGKGLSQGLPFPSSQRRGRENGGRTKKKATIVNHARRRGGGVGGLSNFRIYVYRGNASTIKSLYLLGKKREKIIIT